MREERYPTRHEGERQDTERYGTARSHAVPSRKGPTTTRERMAGGRETRERSKEVG